MKQWELVEEGKKMICQSFNAFFGYAKPILVLVDIYRKKKWDGIYKYKYVVR